MSGEEEAPDRSRSETLIANERVKAVSGLLFNLGPALVATIAARIYVSGATDRTALLWSTGAMLTIWSGWKLLHLLHAEEDR
ncbi:hypothetical protein [Sphingomonas profundi]|uniref:hypothetical protein n=1 Tax=Alterirhizorhabdus profundi TaxID=2681549 RepID=UPI0012E91365|nr:hypothetical protein [Sphingomonas profundi]